MKTFVLHLESAAQYERFENVVSFVAEDASGSFGILSGHARMATILEFGLARFRAADGGCQFVAAPGAVIYFVADELHFATRRYLRGGDLERVRTGLQEQLLAEEEALNAVKSSLKRLEEEMLKRLWRMGRERENQAS